MPISFHCESCKKKIKAPDEAGGKWGSCPYCGHRCYIPRPKSDEEEEIRLAPIDELEESRIQEMMRETHHLTQHILHESRLPNEESAVSTMNADIEETEVIKRAILYLRQMADGELAAAEKTFVSLKPVKKAALRVLAAMARAERPEPELSDIPSSVLQGLIRDLSSKLS
jgi:DNA-directed RNA polymerase subunit RPC12/RpoP